ncbi:DUF5610 domain-containing protein [Shewanella donghaensis]|uniref:DUF5610 domain-containing protein n=1 Tax=Shewanella donghaensis TaxID=238836 RepID=UPI00118422DB|nr:DUF5610 domain-containing protein [Shewanella donghaensis]
MDIYNPTQINAKTRNNTQANTTASDNAQSKKADNALAAGSLADSAGKSVSQISRDLKNSSILAANEKVSIEAGDQSMTLLYRAAIDAINVELAPTMGENAIQKMVETDIDNSPEATAERIVSFATNFFSVHQQQNSDMDFEQQLDTFMEKISGAIDQGFKEATDILSGLKVLEGEIAEEVDNTYSLIQEGLEAFRLKTLPAAEE